MQRRQLTAQQRAAVNIQIGCWLAACSASITVSVKGEIYWESAKLNSLKETEMYSQNSSPRKLGQKQKDLRK